jgi:hypothetical protein
MFRRRVLFDRIRGAELFVAAGFMALGLVPAKAQESAVIISRTSAGQLQATPEFEMPFPLELSVFPGISGHATGRMGFHSTVFDDPTNNSYQLSNTADLRFILLSKTPGMEVWNDHGSGFMQTNESFYVGVPPVDTHPVWNLVTNSPDGTNALVLQLHDVNGVYADSALLTLSFKVLIPPTLQLQRENSSFIILAWPLDADDWTPEFAGTLTATNWTTVTNKQVNTGTNISITLPATDAQKFFRLHRF